MANVSIKDTVGSECSGLAPVDSFWINREQEAYRGHSELVATGAKL
jgi:hypothetical protein